MGATDQFFLIAIGSLGLRSSQTPIVSYETVSNG